MLIQECLRFTIEVI